MRNIVRNTKFTVLYFFVCTVCTVTDFSVGALPIGMKFYTAVRAHLKQVFSYYGEESPRDGRILDVNRAPYGVMCFLMKHLLSRHTQDSAGY